MIKQPSTVDLTKLKIEEKVKSKFIKIDDLKLDDILDIDHISIITSHNLVKLDENTVQQGKLIQDDTVIHITEDTESHILVGTNRRINSSTISTRKKTGGSKRLLPWNNRTTQVVDHTTEDQLIPGMTYDLIRIQPEVSSVHPENSQQVDPSPGRGRGRGTRGRKQRQVRAKLHNDQGRDESLLIICGNCGEKGHNIKDCIIQRIIPHSESEQDEEAPMENTEQQSSPSRNSQPLCYSITRPFTTEFTPFALGRSLKKSRRCALCKEEGHNARTCHYFRTRVRSRSHEREVSVIPN